MLHTFHKLPDVIVLTETRFNENSQHSFLDGYESFHTFRRHRGGGGVSVYVGESIQATKLRHLSLCTETIESCVVMLRDVVDVVIFGIYRLHTDTIENFNSKLQDMLQDVAVSKKQIILTGDINIDLLSRDNYHVNNFVNSMNSIHLLPVITKPTRFAPDNTGKNSCLDHIWVNNLSNYVSGIIYIDMTDHCPSFYSFIKRYNSKNESTKIVFRSYKSIYYNNFVAKLTSAIDIGYAPDEVSENTDRFCNAINDAYCEFSVESKVYF